MRGIWVLASFSKLLFVDVLWMLLLIFFFNRAKRNRSCSVWSGAFKHNVSDLEKTVQLNATTPFVAHTLPFPCVLSSMGNVVQRAGESFRERGSRGAVCAAPRLRVSQWGIRPVCVSPSTPSLPAAVHKHLGIN